MKKLARLWPALTLLIYLAMPRALASDWPQFRGAGRDGKSDEKGLLKQWPAGGPTLLWKVTGIGAGYGSTAVANGIVYTTGGRGGQLVLTALDLSGKKLWEQTQGPTDTGQYAGSRSTPTIDGANLYLMSSKGLLVCRDARTGAPRWSKDLNRDFGGRDPNWGRAESILIYQNLAFATPGRSNCIVALDKLTGRTVWTGNGLSDDVDHVSPIAFEYKNVPMLVTVTRQAMVGVDIRNGRMLWRNTRVNSGTANCSSPVFEDGYVFAATGYGSGGACVKLEVGGNDVFAPQVWETKDMVNHHGGYVVVNGYIYGNHNNGWSCLEMKTGRKLWEDRGVGKGSLIYADGMLYTYSERRGRLGLVEAKPDGFRMVSDFSVEGEAQSWAYPAISDGRLYVRYGDNLYCFDIRGPQYETLNRKETKPAPKTTQAAEKPAPEPRPAPKYTPRPQTDEEIARRLYNTAHNYLRNNVRSMAKTKLKEVADKYPDTEYGKKAAEELKSF
ncbi:MAG: PQQ-like beta-propeller repeat protein [Planctomycetes bacterium]|nr:PQQ-like beta-propeller repeat protein [Planctomycetota bacterium]